VICAIVVTYNRAIKFEKAVRSLQDSTHSVDNIIIIDNASTDDTPAVVERLQKEYINIIYFRLESNYGGAGGFCIGMQLAYNLGAEFFWLMDDDTYVKHNALASLVTSYRQLANINIGPGFICSRVEWRDNSICEMNQPVTSWDWMRENKSFSNLIKVDSCSFVSCLIHRSAVIQVGLPIFDFFIWYDDIEYTSRISKEYPCYVDLNSIVEHDLDANCGANLALADDNNIWKYCFGIRNESWAKYHHSGFLSWAVFTVNRLIQARKYGLPFRITRKLMMCCLKALFFHPRIYALGDIELKKYIPGLR